MTTNLVSVIRKLIDPKKQVNCNEFIVSLKSFVFLLILHSLYYDGYYCKLFKLMYKDQITAVLETTGCTLYISCAADILVFLSNRYQSVHTVSCRM